MRAAHVIQATWEIYQKLRDLYKQHGVSKPIHKIYSEASLGKAYLADFGIKPFAEKNPDFDPKIMGACLEGYYGGRSEIRIWHKITEVIYADFKSQYPTVNGLMHLQELNLAEEINVVKNGGAKEFLEGVTLADLQKKDTWPKLRGFALIRPKQDVLPFRTEYQSHEATDIDDNSPSFSVNVGVNIINHACPSWYTFADIIESKLLTGKCPEILETLELIPIGRQKTTPFKIFGDDDAAIDLSKDDLFIRLIELRSAYKRRAKIIENAEGKNSPEFKRLDAIQNALKLLANSTSYGVLLEVIVDERLKDVPVTVYHGGAATRRRARKREIGVDGETFISGFKVEEPGRWFAPFGGLIPAGGRLLLAISETLAGAKGLNYAFCDTDSMAFAKPEKMPREKFVRRVREIAGQKGWFQKLNPYSGDDPIFALEDANFALRDDTSGKITAELQPLYCLAISAKRYAEFNRTPKGIILRKVSAHGLGDVAMPANYNSGIEHIAAPFDTKKGARDYSAIAHGSAAKLVCDMWHIAIRQFEKNTPHKIDARIRKNCRVLTRRR